jgi:ribosomal protein L31
MHGLSRVPRVRSAPQKSSGTLNFLQEGAILFQEGPPFSRKTRVEISSPCHAWTIMRPPRPLSISEKFGYTEFFAGGRDFLAAILFQEGPTPPTFSQKTRVEISSPCHAWTVKGPLRLLSTLGTVIFFA